MAYNFHKGGKGIIFGALNEMSIAWKVIEQAYAEGAVFTLFNTPVAIRQGNTRELMGMSLKAIMKYNKSFDECV